jgi:hypothetical protein
LQDIQYIEGQGGIYMSVVCILYTVYTHRVCTRKEGWYIGIRGYIVEWGGGGKGAGQSYSTEEKSNVKGCWGLG